MRVLLLAWCSAVSAAAATLDVRTFGAKGDGRTLNTAAIQRAIDACPSGGKVEVPAGIFLTGALRLKSDLTLEIASGGVLQGSADPRDYEPFIRNRFEGWEMDTYASLLNAGTLDHKGGYDVRHLTLRGAGVIRGGGQRLAQAMIAAHGMRSRGRLICVMNCDGLSLEGLTVEESPSWTVHYIYCANVECRNLTIRSTVQNGDGIDPDSSRESDIVHCSFATGDDCIAIKSGKNPEGGRIGIPTDGVHVSDCDFLSGHGISIGSEISGGVRNVLVENCRAGNLKNGLQIKGTAARGGTVENITVRHCQLQKIRVLTAVNYNNDGDAAPAAPSFRNFHFSDLDFTGAPVDQPVIIVHGFDDGDHRTRGVSFDRLTLPPKAVIQIDRCADVAFAGIRAVQGPDPLFEVTRSEAVTGAGSAP